jgi:dipeptidyl aminopeptidase/acylaminoacyl peptidase
LTITALAERSYGGGELEIIDTLEETDTYTRYLISYPSDGLTIYGFLSVPNEGSKFPVAIVAHGYIPPNEYVTEAYTTRYATALTEAGFLVIHPNFRNYPPSDEGPNPFRIGYAVDVLNLMAIIQEQSQDPLGYLRRADGENIHLMGHSMGGGVVLRAAVVRPEMAKAVVLYGSMSGDETKNTRRILQWSGGTNGNFEAAASTEMLTAISPIYHLDRLQAPVSIHHSLADDVVPPEWSDELCNLLEAANHPVECFTYENVPHTFLGFADTQFIDRMITFFQRN